MKHAEILHEDEILRLGVARNLVVAVWSDAPTVHQVRVMARAILTTSRRYSCDFGMLDVVVAGTPKFSDEVRTELSKVVADPKAQGHGAAHVIEIEGMAGVATRAFLSTVFLLGRSGSPNKVFGDLRPAAQWLVPRMKTGAVVWTVDEIVAARDDVARRSASVSRGG